MPAGKYHVHSLYIFLIRKYLQYTIYSTSLGGACTATGRQNRIELSRTVNFHHLLTHFIHQLTFKVLRFVGLLMDASMTINLSIITGFNYHSLLNISTRNLCCIQEKTAQHLRYLMIKMPRQSSPQISMARKRQLLCAMGTLVGRPKCAIVLRNHAMATSDNEAGRIDSSCPIWTIQC